MPQMNVDYLWKIGRYVVVEEHAIGGQAEVYRGYDEITGACVAVKLFTLPTSAPHYHTELQRFVRAASIHVPHDAVVNVIEVVHEGSRYCLIEPFVEGDTLDVYCIHRGGRLALDEALRITRGVAGGLTAIHHKGVVHRDIKGKNILITVSGEPRIIDFGISHLIEQATFTSPGAAIGSPPYMAPEQVTDPDHVDARADVYALAMLFYGMLAGTSPFVKVAGHDALTQVLHQAPRPLSALVRGIPQHIDKAVLCCLAKKPEDRYPSAEAFVAALGGKSTVSPQSICCASCGRDVDSDASFCGRCGAGLQGSAISFVPRCLACGVEVGQHATCPGCKRIFNPGGGRLIFVAGPLSGYRFRIPEGNYTIGRETLLSRDHELSRRHLHVFCNQWGEICVRDEGSRNGSVHCGNRLSSTKPVVLRPNDELWLGRNRAIFQL